MTVFYVHQTELDGVYSVSATSGDAAVAQFESSETNQDAILQAADQAMVINGLLDNKKPVSYIYC